VREEREGDFRTSIPDRRTEKERRKVEGSRKRITTEKKEFDRWVNNVRLMWQRFRLGGRSEQDATKRRRPATDLKGSNHLEKE